MSLGQASRGKSVRIYKRKCSKEGRMTQGSKKMRTVFGCYKRVQKRREDRRGSKRSARSEA